MRKPSLNLRCVADHYATNGERIAEFCFPHAQGDGRLPGGLLSLLYRDDAPPLVSLYRVEGCEIATPTADRLRLLCGRAAEYVERFADLNGEPEGGDCRAVLALLVEAAKSYKAEPPALPLQAALEAQARVDRDAVDPAREIAPGEFERAKLAGYDVEPDGFAGGWIARDPDGVEIEQKATERSWPTERAAWEACDRNRMFGDGPT